MLMYFHVFPTIDVSFESLVTIRAHERSFITVSNQVSFHAALCRKFRITKRTTVWSRIFVSMQMRF